MQLHHLEQLSNPNLCRQSRFHAVVWLTQLVAFFKNNMHNLVMERKSRLFFWHQIILNCQATCSPCANTSHQLCKRCASTWSATIPPSRKATWGFVIAQLVAHQDRHVDSAYTFQSSGLLPPPAFHAVAPGQKLLCRQHRWASLAHALGLLHTPSPQLAKGQPIGTRSICFTALIVLLPTP